MSVPRRPFYRGFRSSTLGPPGRIAPASMLELPAGLEPATWRLQGVLACQLRYGSIYTPAGVKSGRYKIVCRFSRRPYRPDAPASDPCGRRKKNGEKHNAYVLRRAKECCPCPSLYILNDSTDRLCKSMKNSYFLKRLHPSFFHICDVSE